MWRRGRRAPLSRIRPFFLHLLRDPIGWDGVPRTAGSGVCVVIVITTARRIVVVTAI